MFYQPRPYNRFENVTTVLRLLVLLGAWWSVKPVGVIQRLGEWKVLLNSRNWTTGSIP